jgi:hypothetical protein
LQFQTRLAKTVWLIETIPLTPITCHFQDFFYFLKKFQLSASGADNGVGPESHGPDQRHRVHHLTKQPPDV